MTDAVRPRFDRVRFFALAFLLAFAALTATLPSAWQRSGRMHPVVRMRAGAIGDAARETPAGREALFSSLALAPLPTLAALPFVFFSRAGSETAAYLHGMAALLAAGAAACALRWRSRRPHGALLSAPVLAMAVAFGPGRANPDMAAALLLLASALALDRSGPGVHRVYAGFLYAFAALCHPLGLMGVGVKAGVMIVRRLVSGWRPETRCQPERMGVRWIQGFSMAYVFAIHAVFSAAVLGDPLHAFRRLPGALRPGVFLVRDASREIEEIGHRVRTRYGNAALLVSGPWGYLVRDRVEAGGGHHVLVFDAERVPVWDQHVWILAVPAASHPLAAFSDVNARDPRNLRGMLWIEQTGDWHLYRVRNPVVHQAAAP